MNYPGKVLQKGSALLDAVKAVQQQLNTAGCGPLVEDGVFGQSTESAVKQFQVRRALSVDGEVGSTTWSALFGIPIATVTVPPTNFARTVLDVAQSQVGQREYKDQPNRGLMVDEYLLAAGYDPKRGAYSWCTAFVFWCHQEASKKFGITNPFPRTGGVLDAWAKSSTMYRLPAADAYDNPTLVHPGSVFIIDYGDHKGHAGIVKAVQGGLLTTIEGNTNVAGSREGDGVYEKNQRRVSQVNVGFIDFYNHPLQADA
jgi:hypothetical protein